VQITADGFTLIYKELGDADTQYELRQTQHVGFPYTRKLLRLVGGEGVQCQVDAPVAAPLEAWQADDYALVKQTAERYSDQCLARFVETLPSLFPDRPAAGHRFRRSLRARPGRRHQVDAGDHSPASTPGAGRRQG
jgi:hypothetical protein